MTQLHKLHQEIAGLDMQAQLNFKEQQKSFEYGLSSTWFEHTMKFQGLMQTKDGIFSSAESVRHDRFQELQTSRRGEIGDRAEDKTIII